MDLLTADELEAMFKKAITQYETVDSKNSHRLGTLCQGFIILTLGNNNVVFPFAFYDEGSCKSFILQLRTIKADKIQINFAHKYIAYKANAPST